MSKHYQIETNLSLTGSNADQRIQIKPSEQDYLLSNLLQGIYGKKVDPSRRGAAEAGRKPKSAR